MIPFSNATVRGGAVSTWGFQEQGVISGLGLLTFGFIWDCKAIWVGMSLAITTTWTATAGTSSTVWTPVSGTSWGDC